MGEKIEGPRVTLTPEIQNRRILRASSARQSQLTFMLGFKVRACVAVNLMKHKTLLRTEMHPSWSVRRVYSALHRTVIYLYV